MGVLGAMNSAFAPSCNFWAVREESFRKLAPNTSKPPVYSVLVLLLRVFCCRDSVFIPQNAFFKAIFF